MIKLPKDATEMDYRLWIAHGGIQQRLEELSQPRQRMQELLRLAADPLGIKAARQRIGLDEALEITGLEAPARSILEPLREESAVKSHRSKRGRRSYNLDDLQTAVWRAFTDAQAATGMSNPTLRQQYRHYRTDLSESERPTFETFRSHRRTLRDAERPVPE